MGTVSSAVIELFVDSVNKDNGDIYRSLAALVNELMMTAPESGKSMMTPAF